MFGRWLRAWPPLVTPRGRLADWAWSLFIAVAALVRAAAYALRPPSQSAASGVIEGFLDYQTWAIILTVGAGLVLIGQARQPLVLVQIAVGGLGHSVLVFCYATFACSVAYAALTRGDTWSGLMPLALLCVLGFERISVLLRQALRHG